MRIAHIALVIAALLSAAIALGAEDQVTLQLEANPTEVQVDVPIHLHAVMENHSHEPLDGIFSWSSVRPGSDRGFSFLVSRNGAPYQEVITQPPDHFNCARPNTNAHYYRSKQWLPGAAFAPGDSAQRHDMFIFYTPGEYKIKAALKWPDEKPYLSDPVALKVSEVDPDSCIANALSEKERRDLAKCMYGTYYRTVKFMERWWDEHNVLDLIERVETNCPDSPYSIYIDYLEVMHTVLYATGQARAPVDPAAKEDYDDEIVAFMNRHPDSWLNRDLAREAFLLDLQHDRDLDWAIELLDPYLPRPGQPEDNNLVEIRTKLQEIRPSAL